MSFPVLKRSCDDLRDRVSRTAGINVIAAVSVEEPKEPLDELHFMKLVLWCYAFIFEAGQPAIRFLLSLLRAKDPDRHGSARSTFDIVNYLRTVQTHNLSSLDKGDGRKKQQAQIWLVQRGGTSPPNWGNCCGSLSEEVNLAILALADRFAEATAADEDKISITAELILTLDRNWPPYIFDGILEEAASSIGLSGFDLVKYRETRLDRWRELVGFFESRTQAEGALRRAIQTELLQLFGDKGWESGPLSSTTDTSRQG